MMPDFRREAEELAEWLIETRKRFHRHPELGFDLVQTSAWVREFLDQEGIPYQQVARTGVCAVIEGKAEGRVLALRADMDALPMPDLKTCDHASKIPNRCHACGHDAHTTVLMGIARLLKQHQAELPGTVKLLFEPAEETEGGATMMIEAGVLERPHVDAIAALHVRPALEVGKAITTRAIPNAGSDSIKIRVTGASGHGARPHLAVDPVLISAQIINALQGICSREIDSTHPVVITIGSIHGGSAPNVIPDIVEMTGTVRSLTRADRDLAIRRIEEVCTGIATTLRGKAELNIMKSYPPSPGNDRAIQDRFIKAAGMVLGADNVIVTNEPSLGAESFSFFAEERPSVIWGLGVGNKAKGIEAALHNGKFDIDMDCLPLGVAVQCQLAWDLMAG